MSVDLLGFDNGTQRGAASPVDDIRRSLVAPVEDRLDEGKVWQGGRHRESVASRPSQDTGPVGLLLRAGRHFSIRVPDREHAAP